MECFIPVVKHRSEEEPEGYVVDNPAGYEFAGITSTVNCFVFWYKKSNPTPKKIIQKRRVKQS
jgi:hypothetical protein